MISKEIFTVHQELERSDLRLNHMLPEVLQYICLSTDFNETELNVRRLMNKVHYAAGSRQKTI